MGSALAQHHLDSWNLWELQVLTNWHCQNYSAAVCAWVLLSTVWCDVGRRWWSCSCVAAGFSLLFTCFWAQWNLNFVWFPLHFCSEIMVSTYQQLFSLLICRCAIMCLTSWFQIELQNWHLEAGGKSKNHNPKVIAFSVLVKSKQKLESPSKKFLARTVSVIIFIKSWGIHATGFWPEHCCGVARVTGWIGHLLSFLTTKVGNTDLFGRSPW